MVAPFEVGDPARLFIRVPGSGSDKTAKSLCCDLSRLSGAVAAVPVQQASPSVASVPMSLKPGQQEVNNEAEISTGKEKVLVRAENKEDKVLINGERKDQPQKSYSQQIKRMSCKRHIAEDTNVENDAKKRHLSKVVKIEESSTPKSPDSSKGEKKFTTDEKILILEKQCKDLVQKNQQLQQRLSLFCKLFKDPKKLELALKYIKVSEN